jgi:protein-disulfide isomerase
MTKPTNAKAKRAAQQATKRNRTRTIAIIAVFAVVAIVGVAIWSANRTPSTPSSDIVAPPGVTEDLGIPVGTATSPVVDLYEDFQCPVCGAFEQNIGPTLEQMATDGQVKIIYHIMSFLDINLNNDSSVRAANAAGCAQDQGMFLAYHNEVFANQPATEGDGYTDSQLVQFAQDISMPDMTKFQQCVNNDTYGTWVTQMEKNSENDLVTGTPTIKVDGTEINWGNANSWQEATQNVVDAIDAAK